MKKLGILFLFIVLSFSLLGQQHKDRIQKNEDFARRSRTDHFRQSEIMRFAMIWEGHSSYPYSIMPTSDGGYIISAMTWSFGAGASDVWLIKMNSDFMVEWQRTYGGSDREAWATYRVHETKDGGFLVFTDTSSFGSGGLYDTWILKLNAT